MPPRGNSKPKAKGQAKRKNRSEKAYNKMRENQASRWRSEGAMPSQNFAKPRQQRDGPRIPRQVGTAVRVRMGTVGMSDLMTHRVTWVAGTVYIGNGTLGATNSVYAAKQNASATYVAGTGGGFWLPFAPADSLLGSTYGATLMKLYRRMRIRRAAVHLRTIQSSTTNNAVITLSPIRGPPGGAEIANVATDTTAAQTLQNLMSVSGSIDVDSFEDGCLDLTPYIAGGAGPRQNEFAVANPLSASTDVGAVANLLGAVPCGFQVAGNSTVAALQGSVTHNIVCEMVVDLLDFVGAVPVIDPLGLRTVVPGQESKEEKRGRLLSELSALSRDDKGKRDLSASPTRLP